LKTRPNYSEISCFEPEIGGLYSELFFISSGLNSGTILKNELRLSFLVLHFHTTNSNIVDWEKLAFWLFDIKSTTCSYNNERSGIFIFCFESL